MDYSYAAGFFDADGSIQLIRSKPKETRRLVVVFTNTDKENLEAIKQLFGLPSVYVQHPRAEDHHLQGQDLRYLGSNAEQVMELIAPYIHNRKKKERWRFYQKGYRPLKKRNGKYNSLERERIEDAAQKFIDIK